MCIHRASVLVFCLLFVSLAVVAGQQRHLSGRARALRDALIELRQKRGDLLVQQRYLNAFPHDYKGFLQLFDLNQELYDGYDFINVLPSLAKTHDTEVGVLLVGLSKNAHWEGDAPNYLQTATATYAGQHTSTFVSLINSLPSSEHVKLITFLADAENHDAYKEYQSIIDHLRVLGEMGLAKEFEAARRKRLQQPHG